MRLIDAESPQNRIYVSDLVIEEMKKIPTVDIDRPTRSQFKRMAVQLGYEAVIHCRECKEHRLFNGRDMCAKNATILDGHEVGLRATRADFYCADGEMKNDFVDDNKIGERRADEQSSNDKHPTPLV